MSETLQEPSALTQGVFITFEGGDGTGKSTQMRFLARLLRESERAVLCLREPGGTELGETLRAAVLNPSSVELSNRAELLIYEAARAQLVDERIKPALEQGIVVLCDRFYDSTVAYQSFGRGLDEDFVCEANRFASDGLVPDATILITASADKRKERMLERTHVDRLELAGDEFHQRVMDGFVVLRKREAPRMREVISCEERADTFRSILQALADVLPEARDALQQPESFVEQLVEAEMEVKHLEKAVSYE